MTAPAPRAHTRPGRRSAVATAALALTVLALAGCGGTSSSSSAGSSAMPEPGAPFQASSQAGAGKDAYSTGDGASGGELGAPLAVTADRSIIVRADLSVRVVDVTRSTTELGAVAGRHAATIASQSTSTGTGPTPIEYPTNPDGSLACPTTGCPTSYASSTTVLRVENSDVDALIKDVSALGTVEASTRTSDDVTADVADVDARVRNAQASLARVRALMSKATSVGEVVALEGELSKREADLEALQARQRALSDQTAQATVTVRLVDSGAPAAPAETTTGFLSGLRAGWDAFTEFITGALTVVGALIPWLLVLVPLGLLGAYLVRRRHPETAGAVPAGGEHVEG